MKIVAIVLVLAGCAPQTVHRHHHHRARHHVQHERARYFVFRPNIPAWGITSENWP